MRNQFRAWAKFMGAAGPNRKITHFLYREARLLDEKRWDAWYALFTEDGYYWVPLTRDQPDGVYHTSLAYEDRLLLRLRIERLRRRPPSQHPPSWSQHVLQARRSRRPIGAGLGDAHRRFSFPRRGATR